MPKVRKPINKIKTMPKKKKAKKAKKKPNLFSAAGAAKKVKARNRKTASAINRMFK